MPNHKAPAVTSGASVHLSKTPTGIGGLDDLTLGGLPTGRPTLLCGAAGCGKTLFGMTFLVNGCDRFDEPGVFMSFEEREQDLAANVQSLGFDIEELVAKKRLAIDYVRIERAEIEESGEYDLEGLFVRLGHAIDSVGAKRVVLDTIEALFSGLADSTILRAELRRLFSWLKDKGVTAIITAERGSGQLTRFGIEEYVSDCVILLDNRVQDQVVTRRLRVIKYRGSAHGTNEYPFLIDDDGISVLPITSAGLGHRISDEAVPTGVADLDAMLGRGGYFKGSSILISGLAGTGKSTIAAAFVDAACSRGERSLFFAFEESPDQVVRNMRSVGINLAKHLKSGLLRFEAARPSLFGFEPESIVVDPISAFRGPSSEVHATLVRLADVCKTKGITAVFTSLSAVAEQMNESERSVSSLMDTWIALQDIDADGERNRILYLLKSRGMSHSKQIREYELSEDGIHLTAPYLGPEGVLTGAARMAQEAREREAERERIELTERRKREITRKRDAIERQIVEMRAALDAEEAEVSELVDYQSLRTDSATSDRAAMAKKRGGSR